LRRGDASEAGDRDAPSVDPTEREPDRRSIADQPPVVAVASRRRRRPSRIAPGGSGRGRCGKSAPQRKGRPEGNERNDPSGAGDVRSALQGGDLNAAAKAANALADRIDAAVKKLDEARADRLRKSAAALVAILGARR
jgi:hypothetical protein